jgi:hypothetical protein
VLRFASLPVYGLENTSEISPFGSQIAKVVAITSRNGPTLGRHDMTKERRKFVLSILVYITIIALVAFILFHQKTVKQRLTEPPVQRPQSSSASLFTAGALGFFDLIQSGERPER